MEFLLKKYRVDIVEFMCEDTPRKIDYGILDLSRVHDVELRGVLYFIEDILTSELKANYHYNCTGIFRLEICGGRYCYREFEYVVKADSLNELEEMVLSENRIWYVFDEELAKNLRS